MTGLSSNLILRGKYSFLTLLRECVLGITKGRTVTHRYFAGWVKPALDGVLRIPPFAKKRAKDGAPDRSLLVQGTKPNLHLASG
jgi:hypothetical protein